MRYLHHTHVRHHVPGGIVDATSNGVRHHVGITLIGADGIAVRSTVISRHDTEGEAVRAAGRLVTILAHVHTAN